ncbi:uncharacterized protein AMSG_02189 [Thecamonas trahens ATCC 50062]|uniref:Uncharacterized protein n=1 Tax=Thecamonas trahens ATCC 50062 TaxID=461836 RepID=A0A0L0DV52_THETB|nr:hypothetical protein AMSG_02189 [Thecamonas trahens ATCC 50062]KNC56174.1 hypothetical protein AMSG_02189 [Thecamonas trahens ATCC 50062]|eukprot:XP_013761210.1 hypothetical protein AMSG_02189 [Thecamonas trahens ATCC 50062]
MLRSILIFGTDEFDDIPADIIHNNDDDWGNKIYFPTSAEEMIEASELWYDSMLACHGETRIASRLMVPRGELNVETLLNPYASPYQTALAAEAEDEGRLLDELPLPTESWLYRLDIDRDAEVGTHPDHLASVPVYAHVQEHGSEVAITYVTMYPFNGSYAICCGACSAGEHQADVEHMSVYVDRESGEVTRAYFAAHRMRDGEYVDAADLQFASPNSRRLVAYVAKAGHGLYPRAGRIWRLFGFANDLTGNGHVWDPETAVVISEGSPRWMLYRGRWGSAHDLAAGFTSGPSFQGWWLAEHPHSRGCLKRAFCQCLE